MRMRDEILRLGATVPLFTTVQVARYFSTSGSPSKRASEALKTLEKEKLIEGRRREIGKSKVWRLTVAGRKLLGVEKVGLPFTCQKVEHVLSIADIFQDLEETGRLLHFQYEPKDEFHAGRRMIYAPDAFFILRRKTGGADFYLLECQRSRISAGAWANKWAIASAYFEGDYYREASWQVVKDKGKIIKPQIVAVSSQEPENIKGGSSLNLTIVKKIEELL